MRTSLEMPGGEGGSSDGKEEKRSHQADMTAGAPSLAPQQGGGALSSSGLSVQLRSLPGGGAGDHDLEGMRAR